MNDRQGFAALAAALSIGVPAVASAADLPTRKAAPVEYVRVCDAYGAGFFYIPGTDTCLKIGGLALAEVRAFNPRYRVNGSSFTGNGTAIPAAGLTPGAGAYVNQRSRDTYAFSALGRVEIDARNATDYGTLRTFLRVDSYYGSGSNAATGSLGGSALANTTANTSIARYTTILSRGFIQFAGMTAGFAQSMFDFYADAYNYESLRGSDAQVALFAYTATFGGGFSGTISFEDQSSRRSNIGSTVAGFNGAPAGQRVPDIVGNLRFEQGWGAVQLSAAAHRTAASLYASSALAVPAATPAFTANTQNGYGFAVQGGLQFNLNQIAEGDKLWLQAAYERGALSYIDGNNMSFSGGPVNFNRFNGNAIVNLPYSQGWDRQLDMDCVWTASGACEKQWGFATVGAFKHYWIPTLSSNFYGSYMEIHYPGDAIAANGGAVGVTNSREIRAGTSLVWTPVKAFDIGAEFFYARANNGRPLGLASDATLVAAGLPAFHSIVSSYEGRLRVQRAF